MSRIQIAIAGLLALCLAACQSLLPPAGAGADARLQSILDTGELRVGVAADLPPLSMKDKQGRIIGLEIDLVEALGAAMGLEVVLVEMQFAELLPTLERGGVDLVISGLTITPERNARVAFAGPYFISGTSLLARSEAIANVASPDELNAPNRTYVAMAGTTSETFVLEMLPRAKLILTQDNQTGAQLVISGKADALIADLHVCNFAMWRNPDADLHTMRTPFTIDPLGIALPADAPLLLNLVDNYLTTLENTGLLGQYKAKWLADGSWLTQLP